MQFGCETDLRIDHAVGGEILGALGGDASEGVRGLHDPHGVLKGLQVALERTGVARLAKPGGEFARVLHGQIGVSGLLGEFGHRGRPQPTVKVVVQEDLG